jgi:hypothetical protein
MPSTYAMSVTVGAGGRRSASVPTDLDLFAFRRFRELDVGALVVFARGVRDRDLRERHVAERDGGDGAVPVVDLDDQRDLRVPASAHHRQVDVVRARVDGDVADDHVVDAAA